MPEDGNSKENVVGNAMCQNEGNVHLKPKRKRVSKKREGKRRQMLVRHADIKVGRKNQEYVLRDRWLRWLCSTCLKRKRCSFRELRDATAVCRYMIINGIHSCDQCLRNASEGKRCKLMCMFRVPDKFEIEKHKRNMMLGEEEDIMCGVNDDEV